MEYGHWELLCEEYESWKSFVYEIIDENGMRYIGAKTKSTGWQAYCSSSRYLTEAIANGLKCRYTILKFFGTAREGFDYEDELLLKYDCVASALYWNKGRRGKEFNRAGVEVRADTRSKLSGRTGVNSPRFKGYYQINGVQYVTLKNAADNLGLSCWKIWNRTKSNKFPEYTFIDVSKSKEPKTRGQKGEANSAFKGYYIIDGVQYVTAKDAASALGCSQSTIWYRTKSENFPEYTFLAV